MLFEMLLDSNKSKIHSESKSQLTPLFPTHKHLLDSNKSKIHSESKSQHKTESETYDDSWIAINQRYILKANHNPVPAVAFIAAVG